MPGFSTEDFGIFDRTDNSKVLVFDLSGLGTSTRYVASIGNSGALTQTIAILEGNQLWTGLQQFNTEVDVVNSGLNTGVGFDVQDMNALVSITFPNVSGRTILDTSALCHEGEVITYDDDLVSL